MILKKNLKSWPSAEQGGLVSICGLVFSFEGCRQEALSSLTSIHYETSVCTEFANRSLTSIRQGFNHTGNRTWLIIHYRYEPLHRRTAEMD